MASPHKRVVGTPPLTALVTARGLKIPATAFAVRLGGGGNLKKVLNALTVVETHVPGKPVFMARKSAAAYQYVKEGGEAFLLLPRQKARALLKVKALSAVIAGDDLAVPQRTLADAACRSGVPLYDYQQAAVDFLCDGPLAEAEADAHTANAYIQVDTGLGKTRIAGGVVVAKKTPTAVVVPTDAIREQWVDELASAYPGLNVGAYRNPPKGSKRAVPTPATHDVVIFIVNTFRDKEPADLAGYGMVIFDEAHEFHSPVNRQALWLAQARYVWGMSATPEQDSTRGLDRYVFFHLGIPIMQSQIPGFDVSGAKFTGRVRKIEYTGHPDHCETASSAVGTASAIGTIANIIKDPYRLTLVVAEVDRLLHAHERPDAAAWGLGPHPDDGHMRRHGIFLFSEHRAYLPTLRAALIAHFGAAEVYAPEIDPDADTVADAEDVGAGPISILRGGVAKNAVQVARKIGAHVVLTTYGYSRRGISLPEMTALLKATPRRNGGIQIGGRIERRGSDQSIVREVVDIVDVRTGLKSQWTDRVKGYKAKGYPVAVVKAGWQDYAEKGAAAAEATDEDSGAEDAEEEMTLEDLLGS